ncbi:MAG: 2-amino-5-chloromuconate deaminase CnbZ [Candidatus Binataceae bacterium]
MLLENAKGDYTFIRGIGPFSAAVRARPGFAIVHATFHPFASLAEGYLRIERHLSNLNRPIAALCGIQLRVPRPLSRAGFDEFNRPYIERLRDSWGLEVDGANPVTRTNVAFEVNPIAEPALASFFYTVPAADASVTWVLSGVPEIASREGGVKIVAPGDTSLEGLRQKTECILAVLDRHMAELELSWSQATAINLYAVHDLHPLMASLLLPTLGDAARRGITRHYARPPVTGLELEIDACAVIREEILRL